MLDEVHGLGTGLFDLGGLLPTVFTC